MITGYAGSLLRFLERFLLPNSCVACARLVDRHLPDELVCSLCRWRMKPLMGGCRRCGQPLPPIGPCRFCAWWPKELLWARSAVWLEPEAKAVVHHLKYRGYPALADFAAVMISRYVTRPEEGVLVPVPLTRAKERRRGYNQAALLARALGTRWGFGVDETLLVRVREGGSQTALTPEARLENIKHAFRARSAEAGELVIRGGAAAAGEPAVLRRCARAGDPVLPGRSVNGAELVIIVDDVLTTGATLNAAATALVDAGYRQVAAVTFARTSPFERRV